MRLIEPPPVEVPHRIARSGRLQSLYKSGYQDALDGRSLTCPRARSRSGYSLNGWCVYCAGYDAGHKWLAMQQMAVGQWVSGGGAR